MANLDTSRTKVPVIGVNRDSAKLVAGYGGFESGRDCETKTLLWRR